MKHHGLLVKVDADILIIGFISDDFSQLQHTLVYEAAAPGAMLRAIRSVTVTVSTAVLELMT